MDKLSILIPAHNEEKCIASTINTFSSALKKEKIPHEILVVNDHSTDKTVLVIKSLLKKIKELRCVNNSFPKGYGFAVSKGLEVFSGDCVAIVMADLSDSPKDLIKFYYKMQEGYDCVFGSRFIREGKTKDYPIPKFIINRLANNFIRLSFGIKYNDATNAFKLYRRNVIEGIKPLLSHHFNLTVEMPLKSINRGYSYAVLPNRWVSRKKGCSKLKIHEMSSRYLFIIVYCLIEKWFSINNYKR